MARKAKKMKFHHFLEIASSFILQGLAKELVQYVQLNLVQSMARRICFSYCVV